MKDNLNVQISSLAKKSKLIFFDKNIFDISIFIDDFFHLKLL